MKRLILVFLAVLLLQMVSAELVEISSDLSIAMTNYSVTVGIEGKEFSFTCGPGYASPGVKQIKFSKDIKCANQDELRIIASTLSADLNNTHKYYDLYLDCYASNLVCQQKMGGNGTVNYESKYIQCNEDLSNCKSEKSSLITARQAAESAQSTCETTKKAAEDSKLIWGIIGLIIGALGYRSFFDKSAKRMATSPAEQQLPRNR